MLKENDIPLKKITRRNNGGHVFGYRKYAGKAILLKYEQKVINEIRDYRKKGYSYQQIAKQLSSNKVLTKNQKLTWHAKVVRDIFLRANSVR